MKAVMIASVAFIASASVAVAAEIEPVITPGPFAPPPAYPRVQASQEPTVAPGPFAPPPAFPVARIYNWTGLYVGINGGGAFGTTAWTSVPDATGGRSNVSGGLVGGTAGYNLQTGEPYVLGAEADMDWSSLRGAISPTIAPMGCAPAGCEITNPWLATLRLRFGYAFDGIMPYLTGGAAIARLNAQGPVGTEGADNLGWIAGAGVEFVITGALRAKVEYLYVDLNGFSCGNSCNGGSPPGTARRWPAVSHSPRPGR